MTSDPAPWRVIEPVADVSTAPDTADEPRRTEGATARLAAPLVIGGASGLAVVAMGIALLGFGPGGPGPAVDIATADSGTGGSVAVDVAEPSASALVVAVAGAVQRPGVVALPAGSRVGDAITAAGGYGPSVDAARAATELNLAAPLVDGQQIVVPARGEEGAGGAAAPGGDGEPGDGSAGGLVDLNRATAEQLDALPGIGPATIAKLLAAREERSFATLEELVERKVLGPATLEKIRDLAVVR